MLQKFGAGALALALAAAASPAPAVTFDLTATVVGGAFDGTVGTGTFTFDDTLVTGGLEFFTVADGLAIDFTIFGQTFTELDEIGFDAFPELTVDDGTPIALDFTVSEVAFLGGTNLATFLNPGVERFSLFGLTPSNGGFLAEIEVVSAAVPLPAALPLFLTALAGLGLVARRRVSR